MISDKEVIPAAKLKKDCKLGCGKDQCPFLLTSHHRSVAGRLLATKHTCGKVNREHFQAISALINSGSVKAAGKGCAGYFPETGSGHDLPEFGFVDEAAHEWPTIEDMVGWLQCRTSDEEQTIENLERKKSKGSADLARRMRDRLDKVHDATALLEQCLPQ